MMWDEHNAIISTTIMRIERGNECRLYARMLLKRKVMVTNNN